MGRMNPASSDGNPFGGLDLLATAVVVCRADRTICYLNPAAENLFAVSDRSLRGKALDQLVGTPFGLSDALDNALRNNWSYTGTNICVVRKGMEDLQLDCTVTPVESECAKLVLEFRPIDQQLRVTREERFLEQQQVTRELIRNLAHEIKNPLGGIRGSAQLLERELANPALSEYTQVIINEADRLQDLMNRLLSSHRQMHPTRLNFHEIVERVRVLTMAEYPRITFQRDYDASLPDITGDREQLVQTLLNIVRNAAQALGGNGEIQLRTRARRQVTLAKRRYRLALELQVIDNGPGVPADIRDKIFFPLVSGREEGTGLGLTLAQSFVHQHHGTIEVDSRPGRTCFTLLLPYANGKHTEIAA
ncbi:MAG: PAS domain-containing sensor histidine kinase [Rhodocyclaceae bacterium]|nr:PAS domain-containing sensor histidine kinase [Rhodocyclaceae bacterium]